MLLRCEYAGGLAAYCLLMGDWQLLGRNIMQQAKIDIGVRLLLMKGDFFALLCQYSSKRMVMPVGDEQDSVSRNLYAHGKRHTSAKHVFLIRSPVMHQICQSTGICTWQGLCLVAKVTSNFVKCKRIEPSYYKLRHQTLQGTI
jgi:hypothetical protein